MVNLYIIAMIFVSLPLAYLALEDYRHNGVYPRHATFCEIAMLISILFIIWYNPFIAFLQMVIGTAIFLITRAQLKKMYQQLDMEVFFIALITATIPAIGGLVLSSFITAFQASRHGGKIEFPALSRFFVAFLFSFLLYISFL